MGHGPYEASVHLSLSECRGLTWTRLRHVVEKTLWKTSDVASVGNSGGNEDTGTPYIGCLRHLSPLDQVPSVFKVSDRGVCTNVPVRPVLPLTVPDS